MLIQKMENLKRSSAVAGLDDLHQDEHHMDSDDSCETDDRSSQGSRSDTPQPKSGKKTRGRVRINMEFIDNKLRRYTTFSKRKSGIMKKAHELATLTGTQVMLLVASETGHVYTFATRKLQPILSSEAGKQLIQTCLNSPDPNEASSPSSQDDQRMSAQGFEEPELSYVPPDDSKDGLLQKTYHILNAMSAQRERSPTPQQRHNPESQTSSSANLTNYSAVDASKTALHFPPSQSFALMPSQSASQQLDQQQFQLAASSAGVRMQMVPVLQERSICSSIPPPDGHNPQHSAIARTVDESRIALLNPYNNLQRPVAGVQQLLVAGPGSLPMPSAQVALLGQNENNKKTSR